MTYNNIVLALDIDGVLNRLARPKMWDKLTPVQKALNYYPEPDPATGTYWWDRDWDKWREVAVTLTPEDSPKSRYFRTPTEPTTFNLMVSDELNQWILSLAAQGVELMWATTWEHAANKVVAPLLGFPELSLAVESGLYIPRFREDTDGWKANSMAANPLLEGKNVIWLDDMCYHYDYRKYQDKPELTDAVYEDARDEEDLRNWFEADLEHWKRQREDFWNPANGHAAVDINPLMGITEENRAQVEELLARFAL